MYLPVYQATVDFRCREVGIVYDNRGIGMLRGQVRESPLEAVSGGIAREEQSTVVRLTRLISWS